jgi:hypothetical protein
MVLMENKRLIWGKMGELERKITEKTEEKWDNKKNEKGKRKITKKQEES